MTLVWMFPGQSSRYPGMLDKLVDLRPAGARVLEQASALLRRDLGAHYREGNPQAYGCNRDVQVGVFLANHLLLQLVEDEGLAAQASLGLSLGEWNHLVHIGVLDFEQALLAVAERGAAYDAGPRGAMASVFPIGLAELTAVARRAAQGEVLEVVNLNSPRQQVLSGDAAAIERALGILEAEHFVEAVVIEREVPMHSSLFVPVGAKLREFLSTVSFRAPRLPYLPNRLGQFVDAPPPAQLVELLSTHVHRPVLWRQSIDLVLRRWPDAVLVEVGPRAVLHNLLDKKWHPGVRRYHLDSTERTGEHLAQVLARLRACS
ncbi:MAG: ACP S-malonyltransferase [Deltaproteobacteria bacterium]|nr:ACP S-malonyltransferase [Deltaproteobacteria bacterium]